MSENVIELSSEEILNTDGGWLHLVVGALIGAALTQDLDDLAGAFMDGVRDARR
jgi:hypothetical protein